MLLNHKMKSAMTYRLYDLQGIFVPSANLAAVRDAVCLAKTGSSGHLKEGAVGST